MQEIIEKTKNFTITEFSKYDGKFGSEMMIVLTNRMVNIIQRENYSDIDMFALILGAYLHDIGRIITDEEDHTVKGLEIANQFFDKINFRDTAVRTIVSDCILNHGSSANPTTKEGKIIKMLDKVVLIDPNVVKAYLDVVVKNNPDTAKEIVLKKLKGWYEKLGELKEKHKSDYELCVKLLENN